MKRSKSLLFAVAMLSAGWYGTAFSDEGKALYDQHCLTCHQADGQGVPNMQPPLVASAVVTGPAEDLILFTLLGSEAREGGESEWAMVMPGFTQLSDGEIAALLTYVRKAFDHGTDGDLSAITAQEVKAVRQRIER